MTNLVDTMNDADFVLIDGVVFETEYVRIPDEDTVAEDVVLEAKRGETEIELTLRSSTTPSTSDPECTGSRAART